METTFKIKQIAGNGNRCRNLIQKDFGKIQGVYGLHSDMINGTVLISHTNEVSNRALKAQLNELGYEVLTEDITFRKATQSDADELCKMTQEVIRHNYTPFLGEAAVEGYISSGEASKEITENIDTTELLIFNNEIVGICITKAELIHLLMVRVGYQHHGFGSELLLRNMKRLLEKYSTLRVETFNENEQAVNCYLVNGFKIVDQQEVEGMPITLVKLEYNKA